MHEQFNEWLLLIAFVKVKVSIESRIGYWVCTVITIKHCHIKEIINSLNLEISRLSELIISVMSKQSYNYTIFIWYKFNCVLTLSCLLSVILLLVWTSKDWYKTLIIQCSDTYWFTLFLLKWASNWINLLERVHWFWHIVSDERSNYDPSLLIA